MRILIWHVHGSWTTAFLQGDHEYLVPVVPDRGPQGRGRADTWDWPDTTVEVTPEELASTDVDLVILQRPEEEQWATEWLGRRPGRDVPALWLEHNAPQGRINDLRHPAADRSDLTVVHVTHTNSLFWDCGSTRTQVIEHGIIDPGYRYRGTRPRAAVVVNEPVRRARVMGTDLLPTLSAAAPLDVFGMAVDGVATERIQTFTDVPQARLHDEIAERRVYLHPVRWTSLGLALIEAMHLGMPVVALATTEVPHAVPPEAGVVTNQIDRLEDELRGLMADPDAARTKGLAARDAARARFGLKRFLSDWDALMEETVA